MTSFADIQFGYASAEKERAEDPGLLLEGYIDFKKAVTAARSGPKFLFLGYKGSGKSAIAERLSLVSESDYSTFARIIQLGDFPFTPFSKMIRGDLEPEAKYPTAWSWILLIYMIESFSNDLAATHFDPDAFDRAISAFREMGLSPNADPARIVKTVSKTTFKLVVPKIGEVSHEPASVKSAAEIPNYVEALKGLVRAIRSPSNHYLVIDGLDDILTSREVQYKSLSALIFEVSRLNDMLRSNTVPLKIILLCRVDLFERVVNTNKNKIRQDSAVDLDWYHDPSDPGSSRLIEIANLRARRSLGTSINIFDEYFPREVDGKDIANALLDMTRHTPRDFLQLLYRIQELYLGERFTVKRLKSGLRSYSINYFLPEIYDELSGYVDLRHVEKLFQILTRLGKRELRISDLATDHVQDGINLPIGNIVVVMRSLYECSAVGNLKYTPNGSPVFTFKFRNRHSVFDQNGIIILHKGLWKALNIV